MTDWHGKPYYSLDAYCKNTFHHKCYKIALNAQVTCPNRDGTLDTRGCVFCSAGGSGEFAAKLPAPLAVFGGADPVKAAPPADIQETGRGMANLDVDRQLREGISFFRDKKIGDSFIAYFQAYTNTYGPLPYLERIYRLALEHPKVCGISIATRPDCLETPVMQLLKRVKNKYPEKFLWIELGLQTVHASTARYLRRGYELETFEDAYQRLSAAAIPSIVHLILGLPGETREMILESVDYVSRLKPFGVKLQLLHVLQGTDLAADYFAGNFQVLTKEEYLDLLTASITRLHPEIVIHRVTGDGRGDDLIAPDWSRNKKDVLNSLHHKMKEENLRQGDCSWFKTL